MVEFKLLRFLQYNRQ